MNKRFITILYESEKELDKLLKDVQTDLSSIPSYAAIGETGKKSFDNSKDIMSMLQECIVPVMNFHCNFNANCDVKTKKKLATIFRSKLPHDAKCYFEKTIQTMKRILQSMIDMIPENLDDEERKKADALRLFRDRALQMIDLVERKIRRSTNRLLCLDTNYTNKKKESNEEISYSYYSDGTKIVLENDPELLSVPLNIFTVTHALVYLNYMAMYCTMFHHETYWYYYGSNDSNKESEFFSALIQMNKKMDDMAANNQQLNKKVDAIKKNTSQSAKDNKKTVKELDNIRRKQILSDNTLRRKSDTIIEVVKKRNKTDIQKKLTQKKCAQIIHDARSHYNKERERFLEENRITKYKNEFSLADVISIKREIQRWDSFLNSNGTRGIAPPKRYTRMTSEIEFKVFADGVEWNKFEEWKALIQEKYMTVHRNNL